MGKKIRIAYLIDTMSSNMAGTEKQLLNIIERLDREAFEVTLVCLHASPWLLHNKQPCDVVILNYRGFLKPSFPGVVWRYLHVLREKQFDVIQTFFEDAIFVGYLGKMMSRNRHSLIISRRDLGLGADEPGYHKIYKKVLPFIIKYADGIATNASAIKALLVEKDNVPAEKVQVIGNGIDLPAPSREIPSIIQQYQPVIWIGIVANLKPVKRIDVLLRALAHLKASGICEGIRVAVFGEGRLKSELVQLAIDLGVDDLVHFMGAVDNVSDYLQHVDIGVLCSDKEGLPNAILEYMACGLPVIATSVGGNRELVDETNGICVPPGDYKALGDALTRLVSSSALRKDLGEKSLEKVQNGFAWEAIMPCWVCYYRSLVRQINY